MPTRLQHIERQCNHLRTRPRQGPVTLSHPPLTLLWPHPPYGRLCATNLSMAPSDLQILSSVGRKRTAASDIAYIRDLGEADLPDILNPPKVAQPQGGPAKLRNTHHALARLIAQGVENNEISAITGYTPSRISTLKNDPAFAELVAYYSSQVKEVFVDVASRIAAVGLTALEELQDRLEDEPDKFTIGQLQSLVDSTIGPKAKGPQGNLGGPAVAPVNLSISFVSPNHSEPGKVVDATPAPAGRIFEGQ